MISKKQEIGTYLADDTIIHTKMKLVQYELLQKLWQNTRNVFVFEKMKKEDASGIGTVLFKSSGSSDLMLIGSINSPKNIQKQSGNPIIDQNLE